MSNSILYVETKIFTASAEGVKAIETSIGSGDVLIANPNKEPRAQSLRESSSVFGSLVRRDYGSPASLVGNISCQQALASLKNPNDGVACGVTRVKTGLACQHEIMCQQVFQQTMYLVNRHKQQHKSFQNLDTMLGMCAVWQGVFEPTPPSRSTFFSDVIQQTF